MFIALSSIKAFSYLDKGIFSEMMEVEISWKQVKE